MALEITLHELFVAIIVVLALVVCLIVIVLLYSIHKYRSIQNNKAWTKIIERKITDTIIEGYEDAEKDAVFASYLRSDSFRNLFLTALVSSNQSFSGHAQHEVYELFHGFHLEADAWKKINRKQPYLISGGILELTSMRVDDIIPMLLQLVNHPDKQVYQEAQYALVNFKGFDGLFFLDNLETPLSDWQQIRLLKSMKDLSEDYESKIEKWLQSNNPTVVIFVLRLITQFQLLSCSKYIISLLDNASISVRKQAIISLQSLEDDTTISLLIERFQHQPVEVQIQILKVFKLSKDADTITFLKDQLFVNVDARIKILSAEVLFILGHENYLKELILDENINPSLNLIIKHVLQEKVW